MVIGGIGLCLIVLQCALARTSIRVFVCISYGVFGFALGCVLESASECARTPPTAIGTRVAAHLLQPGFDPAAHLRAADRNNSGKPLPEVFSWPMRPEADFQKPPAALAEPPGTEATLRSERARCSRGPLRPTVVTMPHGPSGTDPPVLTRSSLHRKCYGEPGAAVWGILGPDLAAVCRDDRPADCEPEATAWHG